MECVMLLLPICLLYNILYKNKYSEGFHTLNQISRDSLDIKIIYEHNNKCSIGLVYN